MSIAAEQVHADDTTIRQQRISFTRPDGTPGSITLARPHLVYTLGRSGAVAAHLGKTAASVDACELHIQLIMVLPGVGATVCDCQASGWLFVWRRSCS